MKEIFDKFVKIVEDAKGARDIIEGEFKKYYDINKDQLEKAQTQIKQKMEEAMKNISNPGNVAEVMQKMLDFTKDLVGQENFTKIMEFQKKFPFIKDIMEKFMPKK